MLAIGLIALTALIVFQVRWILRSRFPGLRGIEALATSIPLFLLLFANTYVVMATISASNFSEPLTRTGALYFTVTVFSTVGFGDITAKTDTARLVVTGQMIVDLVAIGARGQGHCGRGQAGPPGQPVDLPAWAKPDPHASRRPRSRSRETAWLREEVPSLR
jgi:Ion channel